LSNLFRVVFSMSLSGTAIILLLLLLRPLLKERFSKAWQYYIWMIVVVRLLVPYSPEHSLVNDLFHSNIIHNLSIEFVNEKTALLDTITNKTASSTQQTSGQQENSVYTVGKPTPAEISSPAIHSKQTDYIQQMWNVAGILWLIGVTVIFLYKIIHYIQFIRLIQRYAEPIVDSDLIKLYLRISSELGIRKAPRLLQSSQATSPMLIGLFRPTIYLTEFTLLLEKESLTYVLKHELVHHRRHDLWYKWFSELALSLHWFNPFLYCMSNQIISQCEISCDEAVARDLTPEERRVYGNILLNTASENINYNKHILSTTLYEDKKSLKERILSIMNTRRRTKKTIIVSVMVALLICTTAFMLGACSLKEDTPKANAEVSNELEADTGTQVTPTPSVTASLPDTSNISTSSDTSDNSGSNSTGQDATAENQPTTSNQDNSISSDSITYSNTEYGFDFTLPASWEGYTIQSEDWQGTAIDGDQQGTVVESGTKLMIRSPKWTAKDPYQDIPIMVFTLDQWDQVTNEKIALGAAPILPSELGRNSKYVFALPARYNYAFPSGYEEVDQILQNGALVGNENMKE